MIKNYIKTAWRSLLKNKFYSLINIAGLTVGLAIGIMILLWAQDELSYDSFHKLGANIYKVEIWGGTGSSRQIWTASVAPIGQLAKQQLPDVKDAVRTTGNDDFSVYKYQDKSFSDQRVIYTDQSFFSVFDFPLIQGNSAKPFGTDNSIIITKQTALKYFGTENAIGKIIIADNNKENFTVSGVIGDFPKNSSIRCDMMMPMSYHIKKLKTINSDFNNDFINFSYSTYLLTRPGIDLKKLNADLLKIHLSHKPDDTDVEYLLLPLAKLRLYNADGTANGIQTVRMFIIIALLILTIACINYVNLSTARSMLRSKEISMRKIIGANRSHLFLQFIVETGLLFALAAILALGLIFLLVPVFNQLSGKYLQFSLNNYSVWLIMLATVLCTLAASSIYPALLLSSFEPLKALKGKISLGIGAVLFRKILVVTQFVFSMVLIIGTMVITSQLKYIRSKDLGYDKTHVFGLEMRDIGPHYDAVKAELLKQPGIIAVTRSNQNIVEIGGLTGDTGWDGKQPGQTFIVHPMAIDKDFLSFFKIDLLRGKSFTGAVSDSTHYILNQTAADQLGMKNPIGKNFRMGKVNGTIIGVVKDFHFASFKQKIAPAIFYYNTQNFGTLYIKTTGNDAPKAIAAASEQFKQYNGQFPFSYLFLDDIFDSLYRGEQREGTLFNYFAGIAIFISCLGLLGLAAFTAQVRTREIGVRKVLGATSSLIIALLAKDFIKLVLIAIVIAVPVAWLAMDKWLQGFAYRINISLWTFVFSGMAVVVIALLTISFQSAKAALANPVNSLKNE
ncbi:putative ABC transport system permease protein [Mucilaginibacter gracilis]|uniref:Putative ABC transport system permease protein n=1 Tax=Mucilaginibacter gracilis TaxID=423350 RepID=A0A495J9N3_9SPHI|nr:ABC transporter permease [Mucilaginibacter gracilis]RKR85730.1 putative ABC transport system permease protein [Mucilaginibacter gracilis]